MFIETKNKTKINLFAAIGIDYLSKKLKKNKKGTKCMYLLIKKN